MEPGESRGSVSLGQVRLGFLTSPIESSARADLLGSGRTNRF